MVAAGRIGPHAVIVRMFPLLVELAPGLAAVIGNANPDVRRIDSLIVVGVDENLSVILRARRGVIVGLLPRRSAVFRNKETARLARRFDRGVNALGIVWCDRQADATHFVLRHAFLQLRPALAVVGRFVDRALATALAERAH